MEPRSTIGGLTGRVDWQIGVKDQMSKNLNVTITFLIILFYFYFHCIISLHSLQIKIYIYAHFVVLYITIQCKGEGRPLEHSRTKL